MFADELVRLYEERLGLFVMRCVMPDGLVVRPVPARLSQPGPASESPLRSSKVGVCLPWGVYIRTQKLCQAYYSPKK